jgi:hypothetical protein
MRHAGWRASGAASCALVFVLIRRFDLAFKCALGAGLVPCVLPLPRMVGHPQYSSESLGSLIRLTMPA